MSRTRDDLSELEATLTGLVPSARLDRDALLYEAGRQSMRGPLWRSPAALFAGLALVLGLALLRPEPSTPTREVIVYVPFKPMPSPELASVPVAVAPSTDWGRAFDSSGGYLSKRDRVLHFGAESLPPLPLLPPAPPSEPPLKASDRSI